MNRITEMKVTLFGIEYTLGYIEQTAAGYFAYDYNNEIITDKMLISNADARRLVVGKFNEDHGTRF
ncbi:hypothetical protein [Cytobacillus gottheilii]|uniref:hypothetical protein n=1 Tax=Cytobacillus gottheilii TaxID=859144 RepID=UPI0009BB141B|nr:hypothetical protein [Cytobacillus gottheilii]